jgi:hypothetical protein
MPRYQVFVEVNGSGESIKIGEFQYVSDAINHILNMYEVYARDKKYSKAKVCDTLFGDQVVFEDKFEFLKSGVKR